MPRRTNSGFEGISEYEQFVKKLNKRAREECRLFATMAADKFTELAATAIAQFYADYTPAYYDRTYDMLNNSYRRYYLNKGNRYYGGVIGDSSGLSEYVGSGLSTGDIWTNVWYKGYHGFTKKDPVEPIQTTPPIDILDNSISNALIDQLIASAHNSAAKTVPI